MPLGAQAGIPSPVGDKSIIWPFILCQFLSLQETQQNVFQVKRREM